MYGGGKGDIVSQYVDFTKVYNEQVKKYGRTREAVLETVRICRDRDILQGYLSEREKEVVDIMMALFDQEKAMEQYRYVIEEHGEGQGQFHQVPDGHHEMDCGAGNGCLEGFPGCLWQIPFQTVRVRAEG